MKPQDVLVNDAFPEVDPVALQAAADQVRDSLPQKTIPTDRVIKLTKKEVETDLGKILSSYEVSGFTLTSSTSAKVEDAVSGYLLEAMRLQNIDKFDFFIDYVSSVDPENVSIVVDDHKWDRADTSVRFVHAISTKNFGYIFVLVVDRDQFIRNNPDRTRSITSKLFLGGLV